MIPKQIGNWKIDTNGITWTGEKWECIIPPDSITERGANNSGREDKFEWMLHMTEKELLDHKDILDFNAATAYAIVHLSLSIPQNVSWEKTLIEQWELMNEVLPGELADAFIYKGDV